MISHAYVSVELAQAKARELARRPGLDVTVVAPSRFFELGRWMQAERPADPEYRLEVLPVALPLVRGQRHLYFYPRGLVRLMRSVRPDIVDLWEEPYSAVSTQVVLARRAVARHAPLVMNPSQQAVKRQPPPFRWGERLVVNDTRYVVGRSRESIEVFEAKGYRGPSAVIGHGIELGFLGPRDKAESRRELGLTHEGPVVAIVGRLVPDKAVERAARGRRPHARRRRPGRGPGSRGGRPARPGRAPRHRRPGLVPRAAPDRAGGRRLHRRGRGGHAVPPRALGPGGDRGDGLRGAPGRGRRAPARPGAASTPAWCGPTTWRASRRPCARPSTSPSRRAASAWPGRASTPPPSPGRRSPSAGTPSTTRSGGRGHETTPRSGALRLHQPLHGLRRRRADAADPAGAHRPLPRGADPHHPRRGPPHRGRPRAGRGDRRRAGLARAARRGARRRRLAPGRGVRGGGAARRGRAAGPGDLARQGRRGGHQQRQGPRLRQPGRPAGAAARGVADPRHDGLTRLRRLHAAAAAHHRPPDPGARAERCPIPPASP